MAQESKPGVAIHNDQYSFIVNVQLQKRANDKDCRANWIRIFKLKYRIFCKLGQHYVSSLVYAGCAVVCACEISLTNIFFWVMQSTYHSGQGWKSMLLKS